VWKKSGGENRKPENSISVESQLKLMPIAAIDRIMHTDMREILSRSIGEEMAMKFEKMLKQATTIKKYYSTDPKGEEVQRKS
jgi:histone H3/H4